MREIFKEEESCRTQEDDGAAHLVHQKTNLPSITGEIKLENKDCCCQAGFTLTVMANMILAASFNVTGFFW